MQNDFHQKYDPEKVVVIAVNTAENGDRKMLATKFRDDHKLTYSILLDLDDKVAQAYGVEAFPTNVVIDAEGKVRYHQAGFDEDAVRKLIEKLIK